MLAVAVSVPGRPDRANDDCADVSADGDAVAVADGVGSAPLGSLGSHTAVALVLGEVREAALRGLTGKPLGDLLARRYREVTSSDREVATTCLFAFVTGAQVTVGQAGDGLAAVLLVDRWEALVGARGEWSNQTTALPRASVECRSWPRDAVRAVFLATDGVSDDLVPGREAELVGTLVELALRDGAVQLEARLHAWLNAWPTRGSMDDRSIAILIPGAV
jgi:hypothetical protein